MSDQTYLTYAQAVRDYLAAEWPDVLLVVEPDPNGCWSGASGRRLLVRVITDAFMLGLPTPAAAGAAAEALSRLLARGFE